MAILSIAALQLHGDVLGMQPASRNPIVGSAIRATVFGTGLGVFARYFNFPGSQTMSGLANYFLGGALAGCTYDLYRANKEYDRYIQQEDYRLVALMDERDRVSEGYQHFLSEIIDGLRKYIILKTQKDVDVVLKNNTCISGNEIFNQDLNLQIHGYQISYKNSHKEIDDNKFASYVRKQKDSDRSTIKCF